MELRTVFEELAGELLPLDLWTMAEGPLWARHQALGRALGRQ